MKETFFSMADVWMDSLRRMTTIRLRVLLVPTLPGVAQRNIQVRDY